MEDRRTIHYAGNTVIAPHPSRKNLQRRFAGNNLKTVSITDEVTVTNVEQKVCATSQCVWCEAKFDDYAIRCRICGNCQYCGRFCANASMCMLCGNQLPDELKSDQPRRVVRFE